MELADPRRTSKQCPGCGKILQEDTQRGRKMLCANCGQFMDVDIVAAMNMSCKPSPGLGYSRDGIGEAQSGTFEPAMTEPRIPVIRIVDMSESTSHQRN